MTFRAIDHQSTLGAFVGKTALKDGKGVMVDFVYHNGADYLPSEAEVKAAAAAGVNALLPLRGRSAGDRGAAHAAAFSRTVMRSRAPSPSPQPSPAKRERGMPRPLPRP